MDEEYDFSTEYERNIRPLVDVIINLCRYYRMPYFLLFEISQADKGPEVEMVTKLSSETFPGRGTDIVDHINFYRSKAEQSQEPQEPQDFLSSILADLRKEFPS